MILETLQRLFLGKPASTKLTPFFLLVMGERGAVVDQLVTKPLILRDIAGRAIVIHAGADDLGV